MRFAGGRKINDFLGSKADWGGIGMTATKDFAETNANVAINNARTADARMASEAKVAAANHFADATKAAGQAQGQASMVSGIAGGIGGLAGGFGGGGSGVGSFSGGTGFIGSSVAPDSAFTSNGPWSSFGSF